ncbi:MAG TPA: GxxExxY protein [Burkholderiales bacterium]|nr:GxxExxY protein [Burkholderiales bacterium]
MDRDPEQGPRRAARGRDGASRAQLRETHLNHIDTEAPRDLLSERVIGAAIEVHRVLGPGLLESAYEECLCYELSVRGLRFRRQVEIPVVYKAIHLECGYKMDLVVDEQLVIELKTVEKIAPIHEAQLLTYLKLSGLHVGLLINFNVPVLKHGLKRISL